MTLPCCHSFHDACVTAWLGKAANCPLCRFYHDVVLGSNVIVVPLSLYGLKKLQSLLMVLFVMLLLISPV